MWLAEDNRKKFEKEGQNSFRLIHRAGSAPARWLLLAVLLGGLSMVGIRLVEAKQVVGSLDGAGIMAAPVAVGDTYSTNEDTVLNVLTPGVLGNDSDPENDPLVAILVTDVGHGVLALNSNGSFTYTPVENWNGEDSFTYVANDGSSDSNIATVSITVNPINDLPVAVDDEFSVNEDSGANALFVLINDDDVDLDSLSVLDVSSAAHGSVVNNTNSVTYTPNLNYHGDDSFTYTVSDGHGGSDLATVTIHVISVNDTPQAVDDTDTTLEDTAKVVDVLANDQLGDQPTTITAVTQGLRGSVVNNGTNVTYTPYDNLNGEDTFTYTITDADLETSTATVTINVTPVNDPPIITEGSSVGVTMSEDGDPTAFDLTLHATDVDGDALTWSILTQATHGTATASGTGTSKAIGYVPIANYFGSDSFVVQVSDGAGGTDTITVNVTIDPINDAPVITETDPVGVTMSEDGVPTAFNLTLHATDVDGDALTWSILTQATHGTATASGTGTSKAIGYVPIANYFGSDSFVVQVSDGAGGTDTVTVNVTIQAVNDTPVAEDDTATTNEDTPIIIDVLKNDVLGDLPTTITAVTQGSNGSVITNGSDLTYTPGSNWYGIDSFTYTIKDADLETSTATVTVTVTAVNDKPVANPNNYILNLKNATGDGKTLAITAPGLLINDVDPDNSLRAVKTSDPLHGAVTVNPDGSFTYIANDKFNGIEDTFTYRAEEIDGTEWSAPVTVTITIDLVSPLDPENPQTKPMWVNPPAKVIAPYQQFSTGSIPLVASLITLPEEDYYVAFFRYNYAEAAQNRGWILIGTDDVPEVTPDGKYLFSTDLNVEDLLLHGQGEFPEGVIGPGINDKGENELIVRVYDLNGNYVGNFDMNLPEQNRLIIQRVPVLNKFLYLPSVIK